MDLASIDWVATAICLSFAATAYRTSIAGERAYALVLIANVLISTGISCFTKPGADAGINLIIELALFETAVISAIVNRGHIPTFAALTFISVLSMIVSANQAFHVWTIDGYYLIVNALFAIECGIIGRRGLANVVGGVFRMVRDSGRDRRVLDRPRVPHHGMASVLRRTRNRRT